VSSQASDPEHTGSDRHPAGASEQRPLVVLGLGNILMADDGVGVYLVREAERLWRQQGEPALAERVEFVDAGVAGLGILNVLERAGAVVAVDAARLNAEPGSARWLRPEQLRPESAAHWSLHAAGLAGTLRMAALLGPLPQIYVFAVQPAELTAREGLSEPLKAALPHLTAQLLRWITELAQSLDSP